MKLKSELINAIKKLQAIEAQLERTALQAGRGEFADGNTQSDILHAKDKIIEAREALEGRTE